MDSITCYGGVGTIGGNKILLQMADSSIFLDFGLNFGKEGRFFEEFLQPRTTSKLHDLLKLDLLPKIDGIYREDALRLDGLETLDDETSKPLWKSDIQSYEEARSEEEWYPDAVFISHAHLDHCGYLPYLGDIPLLCSPRTRTLMESFEEIANLNGFDDDLSKVQRRSIGQLSSRAYFPGAPKIKKEDVRKREMMELEDGEDALIDDVTLEAMEVGHSIPGALSALIESKDEQVVYTGDLRFHGRKETKIAETLDGLRPEAMLCEGTRIDEEEPDDEEEVERKLVDEFSEQKLSN